MTASTTHVELATGRRVEIGIGRFVVTLARVPEERCRPAPPLEGLRRSGAGFIAGSALFHAAVFAAVALFAPSLGATEEDPFDPDRLALLQRLLDASAQREAERAPRGRAVAIAGGNASAGQPAREPEGAAGRPDTTRSGRWAARGTARPEDATLAREQALAEAAVDVGRRRADVRLRRATPTRRSCRGGRCRTAATT